MYEGYFAPTGNDPMGLTIDPSKIGYQTVIGSKAGSIGWIPQGLETPVNELWVLKKLFDYIRRNNLTNLGDDPLAANIIFYWNSFVRSANQEPPNAFTSGSWGSFVAGKDYRYFLFEQPKIVCCKGEIVSRSFVEKGGDSGYTPFRNVAGGVEGTTVHSKGPVKGPSFSIDEYNARGKTCATFRASLATRVSLPGVVVGNLTLNLNIPWVWANIEHTLCCDGREQITFSGSNVPSHKAYIDGKAVAQRDATAASFVELITHGGSRGPGGPYHTHSGTGTVQ
jgi:hypothetical protein